MLVRSLHMILDTETVRVIIVEFITEWDWNINVIVNNRVSADLQSHSVIN